VIPINSILVYNTSEIVTPKGFSPSRGNAMKNTEITKNAAILIENGIITEIGNSDYMTDKYKNFDGITLDAGKKTVLPGFVDSHTHFIWGGYRENEFSWRLSGMSYMEIMKNGGGINSTVKMTRESTSENLYELGFKRLNSMLSFGVTTVEGKSGYGLDAETELKQLRVMKKLGENHPLDVVKTFMGAHAFPEEFKGKENAFVDLICEEFIPKISEEKIAEFCDVFCEENVFTAVQSEKILKTGKKYGLIPKIHSDEIKSVGGTELAVNIGAASADHLLNIKDEDIKLLSDSETIATLLPGTAFSLKENFAPARKLIDSGCAVALASDMNPGSCFTESVPLIISLATIYMKMSIEEVITALTLNGAAALRKEKITGSLEPGKFGDLIIINEDSYKFLNYHIGVNLVEKVIKKGQLVFSKGDNYVF